MEIPGTHSYPRRDRVHSKVNRGTSRRKPSFPFGEIVRGMAMEADQWRSAGHGLPRLITDAAPRRSDRVTASPLYSAQSTGPTRTATTDADRHDAAYRRARRDPSDHLATGQKDGGRTAVQQPHGTASLPGV